MQPIKSRISQIILLIVLVAFGIAGFAQAPNLLNYQGVARNAVGNPLPNQTMNLRLSVHNLTASGATVYSETRVIKTNMGGLFSVQIGSAGSTSNTSTIGGVNWLSGDKYLQVEIDPASNNSYLNLGTVQLASVPYAFNASSAINAATVTTNANLTGAVTSIGNTTSLAVSPALTGVPTAPTAAQGTNTTQIATTAFVQAAASTGPKGAKGEQGIQGLPGVDGAAGAQGMRGVAGPIGPAGEQGIPGIPGANGATGSVANVAAISNSSTANGASITSGVLSLAPADGNNGGIVTNSSQTFAGAKTFNSTIIGSISGNAASATTATTAGTASKATKLATAVNINGEAFDGTADITVTANAGTLTGTTLASNVVNSSLTSVGTLTSGTISLTTDIATTGNLKAGNNTYPNSNGNDGQFLKTNGSGTLSWASVPTPDLTNYVTTNTAQTITSAKTFSETTTFSKDAIVNGITVGLGGGNKAYNTAIGVDALPLNTTGEYNTANGAYALYNNTTGQRNTAVGIAALEYNTEGSQNTAIGIDAGVAFGSGTISNITAIGSGAKVSASNTIQLGNTDVTNVNTSGNLTVNGITVGRGGGNDIRNIAIGSGALFNNTNSGGKNTASGYEALNSNIEGDDNTASGYRALKFNIGNFNTASGSLALGGNTSGGLNTAFGLSALQTNATGSYNTAIGSQADVGSANLTNTTAIGYNAVVNTSNTIQLGNTDVTNVKTSGTVTANGTALTSDIRLKSNISPLANSLATVMQLNPLHYMKKGSLASTAYTREENGFIAQEIQKILPFIVTEGTDENKLLSVDYNSFIPMLTKAIQEQQKQIEDQNSKIAAQQKQIEELIKLVKGQ